MQSDLEAIKDSLTEEYQNCQTIAAKTGLSTKTCGRILKALVGSGFAEAQGSTRARVYRVKK